MPHYKEGYAEIEHSKRWHTQLERCMQRFMTEHLHAQYAAYAAAQASQDDAEQTAYYKRCLEILSETAANVYIQDLAEYVVINPALEGYQFYPLYILDMSTVRYAG